MLNRLAATGSWLSKNTSSADTQAFSAKTATPGIKIILAIKTGCFATGGKFNAKRTAVLFCLFGLRPKIQATCFAGGR